MSAPNMAAAFTRRNKIPMRLIDLASRLMDKPGQEALATAFTKGGQAVIREYNAEQGQRLMDELFPEDGRP